MKSLSALLILFLSVVAFCADSPEQAATASANHWLATTDGGEYARSWDAAAPVFKKAVSREQWTNALHATREPLGRLLSRKVKSAVYTTSLPGAPDGQYVVIQYESSFENKRSALETVTPSLGADGLWRVSGYYIR